MNTSGKKKCSYFAIAGNIGAGKSSLTTLLAKHFKWKAYYESVDENPYLSDFYDDMTRWSFNLQIYFLASRFKSQKQFLSLEESFVQDRTIYEDVEVFAKNLYQMGLMSKRDYHNYRSLFDEVVAFLTPPDLLIYLRAEVPTLVRQIQKRGRAYESRIRIDYLEKLNALYEEWIAQYRGDLLIVDTDHIDFVNNPEHLGKVIEMIEQRRFGLFQRDCL